MAAWDELIGHVLARYDELPGPKRLVVMADHGFTTLEKEVDLNAWPWTWACCSTRAGREANGTPRSSGRPRAFAP